MTDKSQTVHFVADRAFGIAEIASPWVKGRALPRSLLANGLMIVGGLHAAAALVRHWMILRDRTLGRMLLGITR